MGQEQWARSAELAHQGQETCPKSVEEQQHKDTFSVTKSFTYALLPPHKPYYTENCSDCKLWAEWANEALELRADAKLQGSQHEVIRSGAHVSKCYAMHILHCVGKKTSLSCRMVFSYSHAPECELNLLQTRNIDTLVPVL